MPYPDYVSFDQARRFAQILDLKGESEWRLYLKGHFKEKPSLPSNIPRAPEAKYKHSGWQGWGDFLGTHTVASYKRSFLPFHEAREFARSLHLQSTSQWFAYCRGKLPNLPTMPAHIPIQAAFVYKQKGWIDWGDWLGTGQIAHQKRQFLPFEQAHQFAQTLNLRTKAQWLEYIKGRITQKPPLPSNIPTNPDSRYKNHGWISWRHWLGHELCTSI